MRKCQSFWFCLWGSEEVLSLKKLPVFLDHMCLANLELNTPWCRGKWNYLLFSQSHFWRNIVHGMTSPVQVIHFTCIPVLVPGARWVLDVPGWPRAMLYPWGNWGETHLVPVLPIPLRQCSLTSSSRLSPDGTPGPSLVHSTPNLSQEISDRYCFFTSGRPRSLPSPGFPSTTVPPPLNTRCMKLQRLWRCIRNS